MKKTNSKILKQFSYLFVITAMLFVYIPDSVSAAAITGRSVTIGSSVASATTAYTFNFTVPSSTVIKSASFTACTTASGACTPAPGFSASTSTLASQPSNLGDASGWTVDTSTSGALKLKKTANVAAPTGNQTVSFANVVNPSATNATFYIRMATFSDDAYTTGIDTGVVASSTAGQVTVTASVDETLTFTLGTTSVALGALTSGTTGTGTSTMTVGTNGKTGYTVAYTGNTLTSSEGTIAAMSAAAGSSQGSNQFGMNLVANTTPSIGSAISGSGTGTASTGYNTANQFKFNSTDTVATSAGPTNNNTYTVSYIANVNNLTPAGAYSTDINYTATAKF